MWIVIVVLCIGGFAYLEWSERGDQQKEQKRLWAIALDSVRGLRMVDPPVQDSEYEAAFYGICNAVNDGKDSVMITASGEQVTVTVARK